VSKAVKIAVIGAGSATFSLALVHDLILTEGLHGSSVTFMDIDADRLDFIHRLAQRYVEETGVDLRFERTLSREAALTDADFVINTALVGGHPAEEAERHFVDERGYYRGLRPLHMQHQLGFMLDVARDIERICPDAWLIQSSNPVFEGCTLMTRQTGVKVVGLCHGFRGYRRIARVLGLDPEGIEWQAPGLNHVVYLTHFRYRGEDAYPILDDWIAHKAEAYWTTEADWKFGDNDMTRAAIDHYGRVGLMPLGDTPRAFTTWWYHTDLETKRRWFGAPVGGFDSDIGWQQYLERLQGQLDTIARAVRDTKTPITASIPLANSGEIQLPLMDSLANDVQRVLQVNVPNNGAIAGIPDDVVVEGKAMVSGMGIQLLQVGKLPESLMKQIILPRWLLMERELSAYINHDYHLLRDIVLEDHRTQSREQADALLDEWLAQPANADLAEWYGRRAHVASRV